MFEEENKLKLKAMLYAIIKNHNIFIRFIFNVNDILHDDAYISPSVVIKMASEWCIYIYTYIAAVLATMTPISLACAFMMMSPSI